MILKHLPMEELAQRVQDLREQIDKVEERLRNPPPFQHYDRRNDLGLAASLHKYMLEVKTEMNMRHTGGTTH